MKLLLILSLFGVVLQAQDLSSVLAHYHKAVGGDAAKAVTSLKLEGIYIYNGLEHPVTIYKKGGDKVRIEIQGLQRFGTSVNKDVTVVRASNGSVAWGLGESREPGPAKLNPVQTGLLAIEAALISPLAAAKTDQLTMVGKTQEEGMDVLHLRQTHQGQTLDWKIGVDDHLPAMVKLSGTGRFDPSAIFFTDYQTVEGVTLPFNIEVEEGIFARTYMIESVKVNIPVDDGLFEMPVK